MKRIDYGSKFTALLLAKEECGDAGLIKEKDNQILVALIDGLGHGKEARFSALKAIQYIEQHDELPLDKMIAGIHEYIKGTRGAVIAIARIDIDTGIIRFSGMGNIACKRLGRRQQTLISKDGVLGSNISTPIERKYDLKKDELLVFHSDGIHSRFDFNILDKWNRLSAQEIADDLHSRYKTNNDDASCIVLKYM